MEKELLLDEELNQVSGGVVIVGETQNAAAGIRDEQTLAQIHSEQAKAGIRFGENLNEEDFEATGLAATGLSRPNLAEEMNTTVKTQRRFNRPLSYSSNALRKIFGIRIK